MVTFLRITALMFILTGCAKTQYYYLAEAPADLFQKPSDESLIMADIQPNDTLISWQRLTRPDGRFVRVRHNAGSGYVRSTGHTYLYSSKTIRSGRYSGSSANGNYSSVSHSSAYKPVHVRAHTRRTASGKVVSVRSHYRSRPGSSGSSVSGKSYRSSSRSSTGGYRSSSSSRSSGSSYRSSGGRGRH